MTNFLNPSSSSFPLLVVLLVAMFSPFVVEAVPAVPSPFIEMNEDGTSTGKLYLRGDERYHYITDEEGFTVCPVKANGNSKKFNYYYCKETGDGDLTADVNLQVGKVKASASGLKKGLVKSKEKALEQCGAFCTSAAGVTPNGNTPGAVGSNLRHRELQNKKTRAPTKAPTESPTKSPTIAVSTNAPTMVPTKGPTIQAPTNAPVPAQQVTSKNLVILVRFNDHATRTLPTKEQINALMNGSTNDTIKSYFLTNSYGQYIAETVIAENWILLPQNESYYADNSAGATGKFAEAALYALDHVDTSINFSDFDQNGDKVVDLISFFHSGNGAEWNGGSNSYIWSGRTSFSWLTNTPWTSQDDGVKVDTFLMNTALYGASSNELNVINGIAHEYGTCCLFVEHQYAVGRCIFA